MKKVTVSQNAFFGGISDDLRANNFAVQGLTKNFDIFTGPNKLVPYFSFTADHSTSISATDLKQYNVQDFLFSNTSSRVYALGHNAAGFTKMFYKDDATASTWQVPANSTGNKAFLNGCLVEYYDYLWGFQGANSIFKWGILSGVPSITNEAGTVGTIYKTVSAVAINNAGTGYSVNDVLTLVGGNNQARAIVTAVSSGAITGLAILEAGANYTTGSKSTTVVPSGGSGATITVSTVADVTETVTSIAQGVIGRDDNLYLAYNSTLVRVYPSGTVQDQALKLPDNLKITSLCNFGNFLAIACAPKDGFNGVSKVFLWNFTSPDIQEVIDWGEGDLLVLDTIEGLLVGITDRYLNSTIGAGRGSIVIQIFSGGYPQVIKEIFTNGITGRSLLQSKAVKNNRLFFSAKIINQYDETVEGIWSLGRKNLSFPYSVSMDYSFSTADGIDSFGNVGNYFFINHSGDGSIARTGSTYSDASVFDTQILDFGDDGFKKLDRFKVHFEPLESGQTITAKYKVDGGEWETIGTHSEVGTLSVSFTRRVASEFASGREFQCRVESTGGAVITGYTAVADVLTTI